MSWYDPSSWAGDVANVATLGAWGDLTANPGQDADNARKAQLSEQAAAAGGFAGQAQQNYTTDVQQRQAALGYLGQVANGNQSVSAEQLRQGLQDTQAQQQSIAAGASPQNAAAAARTAALQTARLGSAAAGQQAVAGIQERQAAQNAYGQLISSSTGQDINAATASRQNAISGYGAGQAGAPTPSALQEYGPAIVGGLDAAAKLSDERQKAHIADGTAAASSALDRLRQVHGGVTVHTYKNPSAPGASPGPQLGPTAQGLERAGLGHTVTDTPHGKMVDTGKLTMSNTAMLAAMAKRMSHLEAGRGAAPAGGMHSSSPPTISAPRHAPPPPGRPSMMAALKQRAAGA